MHVKCCFWSCPLPSPSSGNRLFHPLRALVKLTEVNVHAISSIMFRANKNGLRLLESVISLEVVKLLVNNLPLLCRNATWQLFDGSTITGVMLHLVRFSYITTLHGNIPFESPRTIPGFILHARPSFLRSLFSTFTPMAHQYSVSISGSGSCTRSSRSKCLHSGSSTSEAGSSAVSSRTITAAKGHY